MSWPRVREAAIVLGVLTALFPFAVAVIWSFVTRQWTLLLVMYGSWFGAMAMMYPLWREYEQRRAT